MDWTPDSWRSRPATQIPRYPRSEALELVEKQLRRLPPLVTSWEVESLRQQIAEAAEGRRFLLQGGDCAESFEDCESGVIANKLKILLQMSLVLVHGMRKKIIRVGRLAGQYAKPRSSDQETRDGQSLPSYRGDLVNGLPFEGDAREPDPQLMLRGYERAALTLNFVRALIDGGFADLHHPEFWDLDFVQHSPRAAEYHEIVQSVADALDFMESLADAKVAEINRVDFYTSHEALHLYYEEAVTRKVPRRDGWYNLSTHMPWVGKRTIDPKGAHVEYLRGIRNPVGIKIAADVDSDLLRTLVERIDPDRTPGRLTLIHRFGAEGIQAALPSMIETVRATGRTVLWCCDPMHGNTRETSTGRKTRRFEDILRELEQAFEIHVENGSHLGGVHFELTGDDVTECVGGARGLEEADLERAYKSQVDPRLNYEQALEMAMLVSSLSQANGGRRARP